MSTSSLPTVIIRQIIKHYSAMLGNGNFFLKYKLPVLAVCREWRMVGCEIIYQSVFIDITQIVQKSYNGYRTVSKVRSNIGLIQDMNQSSVVKNLHVSIEENAANNVQIKKICEKLELIETPWTNVKAFYLTVARNDSNNDAGYYLTSHEIDSLPNRFVKALSSAMPNISKLVVNNINKQSNFGETVGNELASFFWPRLAHIESNTPAMPRNIDCVNTQLVHLQVSVNSSMKHFLKRVDASCLRVLSLSEVPNSFSWDMFYNADRASSNYGVVQFSCLSNLVLDFSNSSAGQVGDMSLGRLRISNESASPICASFPGLQRLRIENCPRKNPLFKGCIMPAHLRKVEIKGKLSTAVINDLSNSNVEHVGKFDVETTIDGAANPKTFYSTTSKLFCGAQIESMFSLTLGGETRYLNTNDVEWTQLVYLELKDPIEYCWLVALVCRFPSLDTAVLYGISFLHPPDTSNWSFDVSDHRSAPLAPWPASIAKMSVSFLVQYQNPQVVSACIKRLLLRTTSLTHFHINFSDYLDLEVFADRFKPYYAHMNRLRFSYQSIYSESNVY